MNCLTIYIDGYAFRRVAEWRIGHNNVSNEEKTWGISDIKFEKEEDAKREAARLTDEAKKREIFKQDNLVFFVLQEEAWQRLKKTCVPQTLLYSFPEYVDITNGGYRIAVK